MNRLFCILFNLILLFTLVSNGFSQSKIYQKVGMKGVVLSNSLQNISLSDLGASANAISEGTYQGVTHYASWAIDGDESTDWTSEWSMPAWLEVEFDKVYNIEQVGVWWASHQHTFSIELSVDGNNWTTVVTSRLSNNSEGSAPVHELFQITATEAKFIRINIETTSAPSSHIFQAAVGELEAYAETLTDIENTQREIPTSYVLYQNYPNPFNPSTTIKFIVPKSSEVEISIFNIQGQLIRTLINQKINAGVHSVIWDGNNGDGNPVGSGLYIYRLITNQLQKSNKMLLIR